MEKMDYLIFLLSIFLVWRCIQVLTSSPIRWKFGSTKLPPGPHPFPIIGNLFQLSTKPHQSFANLSKTYGPLMTLKLGGITTIVISSPYTAKQVLQKNDHVLSSRTTPNAIQALNHHEFSMHDVVARLRSLAKPPKNMHFTDVHRKTARCQPSPSSEKSEDLVDYLHESCTSGGAVDIGQAAFTTSLNLLSNTLFSIDLAHYHSNLSQNFKDLIWGAIEEAGRPNIGDQFPALKFIDPHGARRRMTTYFRKLICFFDGIVNQRLQQRASSVTNSANHDVLDALLNLTKENDYELSRNDMNHLLLDLFLAGIDTISSTLEWAMAELLHNPQKMEKARIELEEVLGKDRVVQESDISKLPYIQAVVKETLRLHPPAPLLVPHRAEIEVEIDGSIVPKDAQILVNVWAIGRDSSIWSEPNSFVPERFVESNIDFKGRDFELIPFGAGRRICPGLPLANRMVHLDVGLPSALL